MSGPLRIGVLDQSPVPEGTSGAGALRNTVDLARLCDGLGYSRYWVAEHHGGPLLAGASPEALIGPLAAATGRMRVGSGGVMLPHYSPLKVAETFSILAALFPGRIDLGIGRASGTDPETTYALQRDRRQAAPDDFPQQLAELAAYLRDEMPEGHPFARHAALPGLPDLPELWLLGSSRQSALWAAELGVPYAFADFINPSGAAYAAEYRELYRPSPRHPEPRVAVGVSAICADVDEEARRLAASVTMAMRLLRRGTPIPVPEPERALRFIEEERARRPADDGRPRMRRKRRMVVGGPAAVRAEIAGVADEYGAEEVLVVTIVHDHAARRRSYELIADAFALARGGPPAAATAPRGG
ncbi:LLM class flavin-dependent oxidoreductase [Miltoncostaea marina]|uniref:LLM class flavin-dependent oxidoreductase n=1 Tax=Miltoncostaea marina TaxID=2843215 RepID=UPI001C3DD74E|nr:LLM class flavin-dependent oxidoreductase [Miltoncostaea marina]